MGLNIVVPQGPPFFFLAVRAPLFFFPRAFFRTPYRFIQSIRHFFGGRAEPDPCRRSAPAIFTGDLSQSLLTVDSYDRILQSIRHNRAHSSIPTHRFLQSIRTVELRRASSPNRYSQAIRAGELRRASPLNQCLQAIRTDCLPTQDREQDRTTDPCAHFFSVHALECRHR